MEPLLTLSSSSSSNASPPAYSRMPPDGHEFPHNYQEVPPQYEPAIAMPMPVDTFYAKKSTYVDVMNEARLLDVKSDEKQMKPFKRGDELSRVRNHQWRNDEKSERSVKDKIAMFSNAIVNASPSTFARAKHKEELATDISHSRVYSKSIFAMNTVGYDRARLKSKESYLPCQRNVESTNAVNIMNRTQSSIDLTLCSSSCSSAYSSCSPDSSLSPMSSPSYTIGSSSTLPRKHKSQVVNGVANNLPCNDKKHALTRTTSFTGTTLHSRSQSLVDVLHTQHRYGNYDDGRKDSLTTLIEQRRRTMSKLRGLVIPEKACESQRPIIDLPEIKSKQVIMDRYPVSGHHVAIRSAKPEHTATYESSWKSTLNTTDIPKYSPAFKRKTLTVCGVSSSASSLSSSLNSSREELRSDIVKVRSAPIKPPRNSINYNNSNNLYGPPVYKSLFANEEKSNEKDKRDSYISRMEISKLQEDSDNDSAVSSSRSSLCQEYSPPSSPSPNDRISNDSPSQSSSRTLRRTLSSETNVSVTSTVSTLTSGSQASCSSNGDASGMDSKSKRILKAESVEAINRKNVLSSAKYSCGQDFKVGSPLIKDVFEGHQNGFNQPPTFQDRYSCDRTNWYDKMNADANIKVAYLEIQDSEESDFSTKENSSSVDTDENGDKSLEELSDISENYSTEYTKKKENHDRDCDEYPVSDVFTKLEKDVYCGHDATKNEPLKKSVDGLDSKVNSRLDFKRSSVSVSEIKKSLEKVEAANKVNSKSQNHLRMSSMDSTASEDGLSSTNAGSACNLLKEQQYGSITSLASSTSLISQQELQQLIDEANQTLEETAGSGGHDLMVIILHRETVTSSIGITLAGGADYEAKEITVHKVLVGSPADKDGRIQKGDRILSINGRNMKGVTHREALSILKAPRSEVVLVVSRWRTDGSTENTTVPVEDPLVVTFRNTVRPARIPEITSDCDNNNFTCSVAANNCSKTVKGPVISVTLIKEGGGLGFSLEGGKDSPFGDLPLTVKKIFTGGCAAKSAQLFAGDELLSLNGVDVTSMSRTEAWNMMKRLADGQVILNVRRSRTE